MTTRTHKPTVQARARILAVLGVTSLALIAVSPANGAYRSYEPSSDDAPTTTRTAYRTTDTQPVDENGKKSCKYQTSAIGDWHPHGTTATISKSNPDGSVTTWTMKCNDGNWEIVSLTGPEADHHYEADDAYVDGSGTLVIVNPHEEYTYSSGGSYYAEP